MENEKLEILNMIRDKAITPEEGLKLLDAIQKENVKFVFEEPKQKKDSETIVISTKIPSKIKIPSQSDLAEFLEKAADSENTINENKKKNNIDITIQTPDGKTKSFNL
ncbi:MULTISPECIES: hypothetical protein [unclassified Treponema]|uniref:SHOCT-like domain-containing protein n=1 Tax=unclassified Treponema TaxID=2638727 RepID=UPI0020A51CBC|nr:MULTISPECIES: hypothetical protein [unclassified Treponema]UTC66942.1 hypothetical protein E4O06_13520 [Treponema sp. OMZ 789]UTC69671.1 hypothetical protein E4O01_13660 [Treponema sp. OMZ 790]UTC72385.1 hypothetical protein E4O02_13750 [Treponema sp. OMZ 791]